MRRFWKRVRILCARHNRWAYGVAPCGTIKNGVMGLCPKHAIYCHAFMRLEREARRRHA